MDFPRNDLNEVQIESELHSDPYLDASHMDGIDHSLASTASSSSSEGGTDIKPQIREQFGRKWNILKVYFVLESFLMKYVFG